jgi:hypothetical protein
MAWITKVRKSRQVRYWTLGQGGCDPRGLLAREPVWAGAGLARVGLVAGAPVDPVMAGSAERSSRGRLAASRPGGARTLQYGR